MLQLIEVPSLVAPECLPASERQVAVRASMFCHLRFDHGTVCTDQIFAMLRVATFVLVRDRRCFYGIALLLVVAGSVSSQCLVRRESLEA